MPQFFLFAFSSSGPAWRVQFHLLWRSQTNAIHAIEVTFYIIWEFQLVLMPVRCLLTEETDHRLALAMPILEDRSHKVALHLHSLLWDHTDSQCACLHLHEAMKKDMESLRKSLNHLSFPKMELF